MPSAVAPKSRRSRAIQDSVVEQIIDFVDQNYTEPISLRHVANAVGYSACHLTTTFRHATGVPVTAWIIKRRVEEAERILASSNVSIATACESVGFRDPCYFTRQFVRYVGMTPGRFRASLRPEAAVVAQ
jgi:AraC-like DNA-binding protein